jgi:hypothetical protein
MIDKTCSECNGELEAVADRTVKCQECNRSIVTSRAVVSHVFGPRLDWSLRAVRLDEPRDEHRVVFDVTGEIDARVVARTTTDGDFVEWEPSPPESDRAFLEERAVKTARSFECTKLE